MSTSFAVTLFCAILAILLVDHYRFEGQAALAAGRAGLALIERLALWR